MMETIYIGFSKRNNNIISKAIQLAEGSEFSHVYIRRKSKYGEYVYQASGLAVNFTNIDIFLEHNVIVEEYAFQFPDDKKDELIAFFIKYAGAGYDTLDLFKILLLLICKRVGIKVKLSGNGDKKFICSELAAFFASKILELNIPIVNDFLTPKDLHATIKQLGVKVI